MTYNVITVDENDKFIPEQEEVKTSIELYSNFFSGRS